MKKNESSAAAVDAFEGVAADLAGAGVARGQTFVGRGVALARGSRSGVHHGLAAASTQGPKTMPVTDFG
jgi:hypothetical protein